MKEFIEKLIGRLEELKTEALDKWDGGASHRAYSKAIDIANELAEEYKSRIMIDEEYCWQKCSAVEHCSECNRLENGTIDYFENYDSLVEKYNNGWIPCSERLPSEQGEYLTYVNYDGDCFRSIDEYLCEGLLAGWNCTPNYRVLAWQPLPPKYEPKGE